MATKHLAKQLGLIRRSSRLSVTSKNGCRPRCKQFFEYLVIIDFESTCWRDAKHYGQEINSLVLLVEYLCYSGYLYQELSRSDISYTRDALIDPNNPGETVVTGKDTVYYIVEFPAVLLNTSNGEIESEFHTYVQPQEHPILSAFCTELTGIKQQQVDEGIPLKICLSQFSSWIQKIQKEKNIFFPSAVSTHPTPEQKMCGFVTWSDWDLGVCLLYECKRKQLRKPDILNSWIDLRLTYKVFYTRKPKGLNGALQDLGIEFAGREHSGLDDSRNTAKLAWRMICDGCVMKITKSLDKVLPKTSVRMLAANGCNPGQSSASQASTNNIAKNNSLASENCCTIFGKTSSKENDPDPCAGNDPVAISKGAVKMSTVVQEIHPPQTLINGLCTTLGNSNKHRFSNRNSFTTLQTGKQIGSFSSTPIESSSVASAHVLISTTVSSVNDISALEISSSSDCLSLLADWEDAAVIEDSQQEPSDTSILQQEDPSSSSILMSKTNMENYNGLNRKTMGFKPQMTHLNSIVYKSPDTTIYNTSAKPQAFNCSTFKLPFALGNKSVNNVSNNVQQPNRSTSNTSVPKRKLSSVSFYSPPKKQPFTIHKDQGSAGNRSLPPTSNRSRVAPTGVLNSTVNMNRTIGSIKSGKITAPVCNCGRRAKRLTVTNVGPNQGKVFYSCSVKKRNEENGKGCEYFKWEQTLLKEKMAHSSALLSTSGISFTCSGVSTGQPVSHKTFIGLRPSMRT